VWLCERDIERKEGRTEGKKKGIILIAVLMPMAKIVQSVVL